MAILMTAEVPGMTSEPYDGVIAAIGEQMRQAKGFIAHAAGMVDGVWHVTEMWESSEDAAKWFAEAVQPNLPEGIKPKRTIHELHNLLTP